MFIIFSSTLAIGISPGGVGWSLNLCTLWLCMLVMWPEYTEQDGGVVMLAWLTAGLLKDITLSQSRWCSTLIMWWVHISMLEALICNISSDNLLGDRIRFVDILGLTTWKWGLCLFFKNCFLAQTFQVWQLYSVGNMFVYLKCQKGSKGLLYLRYSEQLKKQVFRQNPLTLSLL